MPQFLHGLKENLPKYQRGYIEWGKPKVITNLTCNKFVIGMINEILKLEKIFWNWNLQTETFTLILVAYAKQFWLGSVLFIDLWRCLLCSEHCYTLGIHSSTRENKQTTLGTRTFCSEEPIGGESIHRHGGHYVCWTVCNGHFYGAISNLI